MTDAPMTPLTLHYHPFSRAANVLLMLEEVGVAYSLSFVDLKTGAQGSSEFRQKNPMGKLPTLVDGEALVTESAAIGLYLADRYAPGRLAPLADDPRRGTYLRWSFFAPSVIEPCCYAHGAKWDYRPASAGWGTYGNMLEAISAAIGDGPYLLGKQFTMADIIFGGTLRYMLRFGMLDARPEFVAYVERMSARPAIIKADARNAAEIEAHGLST